MTTLYRSPSIVIDGYEWHIHVRKDYGHVTMLYNFRPMSPVRYRWKPIVLWKGVKPADLSNRLAPYRKHAMLAIENDKRRASVIGRALLPGETHSRVA